MFFFEGGLNPWNQDKIDHIHVYVTFGDLFAPILLGRIVSIVLIIDLGHPPFFIL